MSSQHTSGPYGVFADERNIIVSTSDGKTRLARLLSANGADLGNAHLFATSWELLLLAKRAEAMLLTLGGEQVASTLMGDLRAGIAKAEGRL